jgi:Protein of unknown function (DUF4236)
MGFRFFRRFRILPGITLNLSRSGPSISAGPRGLKVTVGPKGKRFTAGIPGTGAFYTKTEKCGEKANDMPHATNGRFLRVLFYVLLTVLVFFIVKEMLAH